MVQPNLKRRWGILHPVLAGVLAITAAVEWGGAGPSKGVVGVLTFVIVYGLLRSGSPADS